MCFYTFCSICFALYFREGNEPGDELTVTYRELLHRVCQFANVLKSQGTLKLPDPPLRSSAKQPSYIWPFPCFVVLCLPLCGAGVKKGDRVSIYMPMVVELVVAMLACARIGAVHSIVVSLKYISL